VGNGEGKQRGGRRWQEEQEEEEEEDRMGERGG